MGSAGTRTAERGYYCLHLHHVLHQPGRRPRFCWRRLRTGRRGGSRRAGAGPLRRADVQLDKTMRTLGRTTAKAWLSSSLVVSHSRRSWSGSLAMGMTSRSFWPVRHRHGRRASEASGGSGDQDGSRADLTHRGSPRDRRGPCPPRCSVSWSCVHQPSSPSSSWNVPVGPSLPIVAIRTMLRALIPAGRPREFFTPPSSVAV